MSKWLWFGNSIMWMAIAAAEASNGRAWYVFVDMFAALSAAVSCLGCWHMENRRAR